MPAALSHYLDSIRDSLKLAPAEEKEIISELETHVEDRFQELKESGLSEEEASQKCLGLLGSARLAARQIYEAHSQGTWKQALLASMPHLLFGLLFALNWWQHIGWLSFVLGLVFVTTIYGWIRGKPNWVFPCLGYTLLPVLVAGLLLLYLPEAWSLLAVLIYFPLALWWLGYILIQTTRRDWLFSSLMLLPLPVIAGWFLAISPDAKFTEGSLQRVYDFAPWIAVSFFALALTIAAFIRIRQRWLRTALLVISGILTMTMVSYYANDRLNLSTLLGLILVMWGIFLVPPLLERIVRKRIARKYRYSFIGMETTETDNQPALQDGDEL